MMRMPKAIAAALLAVGLIIAAPALAQDKAAAEHDHSAKTAEGAKTMMDGCDMMKSDAEKGARMMGEGHAKMMEGMKMTKGMDPAMKKKMLAADKKMMLGKKMMMDGMKMMHEGKEEMSKVHSPKP